MTNGNLGGVCNVHAICDKEQKTEEKNRLSPSIVKREYVRTFNYCSFQINIYQIYNDNEHKTKG